MARLPQGKLEREFGIVYDEETIENAVQTTALFTKRARDNVEREHGVMEPPVKIGK